MTQMQGTNGRTPDEIQRDIEYTRTRMDHTLEAIKHQLTPGGLLNEAMHHAGRISTDVFEGVGRTVRQNPLPAAVVGAGLVWLIVSESRRKSEYRRGAHAPYPPSYGYGGESSYGPPPTDPYGEDPYAEERMTRPFQEEGHEPRVKQVAKRIEERVTNAAEGVKRTGRRIAHTADRMGERVGHASHVAIERSRYGARRARDEIANVVDDQPLVLVAVGIGLGALVGALLPGTSREDRTMGPYRDRAMRKARQLGEEGLERAKTVAGAAADAATDAFENELNAQRDGRDSGREEKAGRRSTQQYGAAKLPKAKAAPRSSFAEREDNANASTGKDTPPATPYETPQAASVRGAGALNAGEASAHVEEIHSDPMTFSDTGGRGDGQERGRGN